MSSCQPCFCHGPAGFGRRAVVAADLAEAVVLLGGGDPLRVFTRKVDTAEQTDVDRLEATIREITPGATTMRADYYRQGNQQGSRTWSEVS